jgi:hypothetical protein
MVPTPQGVDDKLLASTPREKTLAGAGVPRAFWHTKVKDVSLTTCMFQRRQVSPKEQQWHLRCLAKDPRRQLCCLAAPKEEDPGLALAIALANAMHIQVALVDAQYLPVSLEHFPGALVLYNILATATDDRFQAVRDACLRFRGAVRILVATGTKDPSGWCYNKIRLSPDCVAVATRSPNV